MNEKYREHIKEENMHYDLLKANPQYKPCGRSKDFKKVIVGIIKGNPSEYKQGIDHLNFKYFDTWKDAYLQLSKEV